MYPFWKSDLKAFNIEKGSYGWSAYDIKIVLCSGSNYTENLFNFKNYQLNFTEVMIVGVSISSYHAELYQWRFF